MNPRIRLVLVGLMLSAAMFSARAAEALRFQPLLARDVPAVVQAPRARPLIVEIWSLDCGYCRENIARIAQWRRSTRQQVDVVMVAMDGPEQAGLHVERVSLMFASLFPLMLAARTAQRVMRPFRSAPSAADMDVPWAPINAALKRVLDGEAALARHVPMPIGTSVIVVARKDERR